MFASSRKPCAATNTPGRIWNPPLRSTVGAQPIPGGCNRPGDRNLALPATPVEADSISARFTAAQGPAGGINPAPTNKMLCFGPTGTIATARATVGRDALVPPHPAPPQCSAGGPWPSPTNRGKHGGPAENRKPRGQPPSPCSPGAHCAPGLPFRRAASFKRQPAVRQSLRHGLRPCHLPLTREAKPPQTLRNPHPL